MKRILRQIYDRHFSRFTSNRKKKALRKRVSTLLISQQYPYDVEAKLLRYIGVQPSPVFDIGANTGFYSAILEDIVGTNNLYMFEPIPYLYQLLKNKFKNAHVFNFALSEIEMTQNLRVPYINGKRFDTRATLNRHDELDQTGYEDIEVRSITLDKISMKLNLNSIGLIKIDVEGHEVEVLNGGIETITQFKPLILIEIEQRHHRDSIINIFSKFENIGFKGYYVNPKQFELLATSQFNSQRDQNLQFLISRDFIQYLNNFFFVHESSADEFVSNAMTFLESEMRFVEQAASVDARSSR